jgi:hypothetical protein
MGMMMCVCEWRGIRRPMRKVMKGRGDVKRWMDGEMKMMTRERERV